MYSYSSLNNPRMAAIKAGLGLAYLFAGRQLVTGNPKLGYDLGSVTSLALVGLRHCHLACAWFVNSIPNLETV